MSGPWCGPGLAPPLLPAGDAPLLRADEQVFEAMLEGWSEQQRSRGLRTEHPRLELAGLFLRQLGDCSIWR